MKYTPFFLSALPLLGFGCIEAQDHGERPDVGAPMDGATADTGSDAHSGDTGTAVDAGVRLDGGPDAEPGLDAGLTLGATAHIGVRASADAESSTTTILITPWISLGEFEDISIATSGDCSLFATSATVVPIVRGVAAQTDLTWWTVTLNGTTLITRMEDGYVMADVEGTSGMLRVEYLEPGGELAFIETNLISEVRVTAPNIVPTEPGFAGFQCLECGDMWDGEVRVTSRAADDRLQVRYLDNPPDGSSPSSVICDGAQDSLRIPNELFQAPFERISNFSPSIRRSESTESGGIDLFANVSYHFSSDRISVF